MAHLRKGDKLAEDKPYNNHLGIGGEGQFLHHAGEDRRHHQHVSQVHCQGSWSPNCMISVVYIWISYLII